jgi:ATP-binding cassette subfamily B protein
MAGYEEASIKIYWSLGVLNFVQNVIISIGLMLLMCLAAYDVMQGEKRIGDFVMVNAFLLQLYMPLNFLGTVFREIKQSLIDMENMFNLLSEKQEVLNKIAAPDLNVTNAYIQFENVKFFYDADREIIKNLSFEVPAGSTLAIVGTSGAGKSTISRILYRFYDIQSGHVKIDGQDIREVSQETLRKVIGIVPQDTVLFNDTIGYNIRYGNMNATDEQVEEAAKFAQIDAFIKSLPQGMNTVVGERGLKLSGGEKQRIAIARTILKNPPILILDEATSALDTDTEKEIQSALNDIARNRTTLIIAHRLSTIVDADNILVLEKGEIIEQGNHTYLLSLNGRYASMWYKQKEAKAAQEKLKILKEV